MRNYEAWWCVNGSGIHIQTHTTGTNTHTHAHTTTLPTEPEPLPVRQVYGSIEGTWRELSLSVELMKPAPTGIKEWRELALRSFTHSLTSFLYRAPDEVMLSLLKGNHK